MNKQGILLIISGPSGSGKSTFLRCLNRLQRDDCRASLREEQFFAFHFRNNKKAQRI